MAGKRILLEGLPNTRDLGGYRSLDGRELKDKKVIRSGTLFTATQEDLRILKEEYQLSTIVDFRTKTERKQKPDPVIDGISYIENAILEEAQLGITHEGENRSADLIGSMISMCRQIGDRAGSYLSDLYPALVKNPFAQAGYRRFLELLLCQEQGAVLYHCSEGKDRVGTGTALFLSILGMPRELILEDYLLTNQYTEQKRQHILSMIRQQLPEEPEICERFVLLNSVQENYIKSVFHTIDQEYGCMESFLEQCMGMTKEKREKMQEIYLR